MSRPFWIRTADPFSRGDRQHERSHGHRDHDQGRRGLQIQLAAPALGLGTTFTGSIDTAGRSYPPLIEIFELPEGNVSHGTFVIEYPAEKDERIPTRKPVDVTWC